MASKKPSWTLESPIAEETQAMVVSGFGSLDLGRALFLELPENAGGKWLADLQEHHAITAASQVGSNGNQATGKLDAAVSIAFTWTGLQRMGLPAEALASFSTPFKEGMFQVDRLRRLGDRRTSSNQEHPDSANPWLDTTGGVCPKWSGNAPSQRQPSRIEAFDVAAEADDETVSTDTTVHVALLVYANEGTDELVSKIEALLERHNVRVSHSLPLDQLKDEGYGFGREHFGFADGLSQPAPFDAAGAVIRGKDAVTTPAPVQGVPLGEFLIGYKNGHQERAPGPVVDGELPQQAGLKAHDDAQGFSDLGLNGSYLVIRELRQDVPAFWRSMEAAAKVVRDADPEAEHFTAEWLAERIVGRTIDGNVIRPDGPKKPAAGELPDSDFTFFDEDRWGAGCPLGSHVRRAHPRDSLAPDSNQKQTLLNSANNHRILRRGRTYGPPIDDPKTDDGQDRGLLFMCLNTDIARQFEFIQQTWLLNSDFSTLFEEVDPLLGSDGSMTIPSKDGLRRRVHVETFIHMVGGDYFFLPSVPALRYLAML